MPSSLVFVTTLLDLREDRSRGRPLETRVRHFKQLASSGIPIVLFLSRSYESYDLSAFPNVRVEWFEFEDLPLWKRLKDNTFTLPPRRTPDHDTPHFMILMNSKVDLIRVAMDLVPSTHYAWIDFNVAHVVKTGLGPFLNRLQLLANSRLRTPALFFPGCGPWYKGAEKGNEFTKIMWRLCGGFFIGDRDSLIQFQTLLWEKGVPLFLERGLTWEVNLWAYLENTETTSLPIWYEGSHDATLVHVPSAEILSVVASLTTIPPRLHTTCRATLDSLLDQVDHIYLSVSKTYRRWPEPYVLPDYLFQPPYRDRVTVVLCEDLGSIAKVLGPQKVLEPTQWTFVCDDDQVYKPGLVKAMMSRVDALCIYQNRYEAIRQNTTGGMIHGYVGFLAHNSFWEGLEVVEEGRRIDDQVLSAHAYRAQIPIRSTGLEQYEDLYAVLDQGHEQGGADALSALGTRDQEVMQLSEALRLRFLRNGEVMRFLCREPGVRLGSYTYPTVEGSVPTSSSFLTYRGAPLLNIRYVNYRLTAEGQYVIHDPAGALRTQNVLAILDDSLTRIETSILLAVRTSMAQTCVGIHGLEDIRLYEEAGALRFVATQREWSPSRQNRCVRGDVVGPCLTHLEVLEPPIATGCEKNWIPWGPDFIYGFHPLQIGSVKDGHLSIHTEWATPPSWASTKGSTVPFLYQGAHWLVVHSSDDEVPRHYRHRLIVLESGTGRPLQSSPPFVFGRNGIEFCIGFCIREKEREVQFWYSQHDCDPVWLTVPLDLVVSWMSPVENTKRV
jgi:hypothetical protein